MLNILFEKHKFASREEQKEKLNQLSILYQNLLKYATDLTTYRIRSLGRLPSDASETEKEVATKAGESATQLKAAANDPVLANLQNDAVATAITGYLKFIRDWTEAKVYQEAPGDTTDHDRHHALLASLKEACSEHLKELEAGL